MHDRTKDATKAEIVDIYLHASKESMLNQGQELGLTGEALNTFMYACYEVRITMLLNRLTGETEIIAVDGVALE